MGWKEAQKRYKQRETLTDQKAEDLVARRVLRGLGLQEKWLARAERLIRGEVLQDEALWPRTLWLLKRGLVLAGQLRLSKVPIDVFWARKDHKDILERLELGQDGPIYGPIILTRVRSTTTSLAYSVWPRDEVGKLVPPYSVIAETIGGEHIAVQETEHFITQFGPYFQELQNEG
jgi:hypothetical protein